MRQVVLLGREMIVGPGPAAHVRIDGEERRDERAGSAHAGRADAEGDPEDQKAAQTITERDQQFAKQVAIEQPHRHES